MEVRKINLTIITTDEFQGDNIRGVCSYRGNESGYDDYIILMNGNCSDDQQALTFIHEMLHVWHEDHKQENLNVNMIEAVRHEEQARLLRLALKEE